MTDSLSVPTIFSRVCAHVATARLPNRDLSVEYRVVGRGVFHQVFSSSRLSAYGQGSVDSANLVLRQSERAFLALILGRGKGNAIARETQIAARGDGQYLACAPMSVLMSGALQSLSPITKITMRVAYELNETPVGTLFWLEDWRDGQLHQWHPVGGSSEPRPDSDIVWRSTLSQYANSMGGRWTPRRGLWRGIGVQGKWPLLLSFARLIGRPGYRQAFANPALALPAQVALGELRSSHAYVDALILARASVDDRHADDEHNEATSVA